MATNEEYQELVKALSGECERLHKENEEVKKALEKLERWEKHYCFDCKYFTENEERYNEEHCSKCTLIGTEWEQKK